MSVTRVIPAPDRLIQRVSSFLAEARQFDQGIFGMKTVPMVVNLDSATPSGQQTFTVPDGYTFRFNGVKPHVLVLPDATIAQAATYNPTGQSVYITGNAHDLVEAYLQNTLVRLRTTYNKIEFFNSKALPLSSLSRRGAGGGRPFPTFGFPNIIRSGTLIQLDVTCVASTLLPTAPDTLPLGLHLVGALIPEN